MVPLRYRNNVGLIYVYRPRRLAADLENDAACRLLPGCGYAVSGCSACIRRLIQRLEACDGFPHEIGLFLGYPPEDVDGFINRHGEAKYTGIWKVYGDVPSALRTFERFKKCTEIYMKKWAEGSSIERLTVAHR